MDARSYPAAAGHHSLRLSIRARGRSLTFVFACVLIFIGWWYDLLNSGEVLAAVGLIVLPYLGRGFDTYMASQARFMTVVFPAYLVAGQLLRRFPSSITMGILSLSAALLVIYSACFASEHFFW